MYFLACSLSSAFFAISRAIVFPVSTVASTYVLVYYNIVSEAVLAIYTLTIVSGLITIGSDGLTLLLTYFPPDLIPYETKVAP